MTVSEKATSCINAPSVESERVFGNLTTWNTWLHQGQHTYSWSHTVKRLKGGKIPGQKYACARPQVVAMYPHLLYDIYNAIMAM